MFKNALRMLTFLIVAALVAYGIWYATSTSSPVNTNQEAVTNATNQPLTPTLSETMVGYITNRELYTATRDGEDSAWTTGATGITADAISVWNDNVLVTATHVDQADQALQWKFKVNLSIRDPLTLEETNTWVKDGVESYRVSRNADQILYTNSDYELHLYDVKYKEDRLLETGVHQLFDGGSVFPLTWNEDLAQLAYTKFEFRNQTYESVGSMIYDLATNTRTVVGDIAGKPIEALVDENGERWVYYATTEEGIRNGLRRLNLTTLEDEEILLGTDIGPYEVDIQSISDPLYYVYYDGKDYDGLLRIDKGGTSEVRIEVVGDVRDYVVRSNNELLVSEPKSSPVDLRLVATKPDGTDAEVVSETVADALWAPTFAWKESGKRADAVLLNQ